MFRKRGKRLTIFKFKTNQNTSGIINEMEDNELKNDVALEFSSATQGANHRTYKRFYYTRNLLHNKYHEFILSLDNKTMLERLNSLLKQLSLDDAEFERLVKRIESWNNLKTAIPGKYVEFIGVNPISIETALRADMKEFKEAMQRIQYPDCFFISTSSGVLRVSLPVGTTEKQAIEMAMNFRCNEEIKAKYITISDLKTIVIEPDGNYYTLTYPPTLTFRKNMYIPAHAGECDATYN